MFFLYLSYFQESKEIKDLCNYLFYSSIHLYLNQFVLLSQGIFIQDFTAHLPEMLLIDLSLFLRKIFVLTFFKFTLNLKQNRIRLTFLATYFDSRNQIID